MESRDDILALVGPHCDLQERLQGVPPSAQIRGLLFRSIDTVLNKAGLAEPYRALIGRHTFSSLRFYPAADYLLCIAAGGALLESPERVHLGMTEIGRRNATAVSESLLGRTLLRILSPNPERLLQQGMAARRQTCRYGNWQLRFPRAGYAEMHFTNEYQWIESALLGAARGTFESVGLEAQVECELLSPFSGVHRLTWS